MQDTDNKQKLQTRPRTMGRLVVLIKDYDNEPGSGDHSEGRGRRIGV